MAWMLVLAASWSLLSPLVALLVGHLIRSSDPRSSTEVPDHVPADWAAPAVRER